MSKLISNLIQSNQIATLHKKTEYKTDKVFYLPFLNKKSIVPQFKDYPRFPKLFLPDPLLPKISLIKALYYRQSQRQFVGGQLDLENLSTLIYFSVGIKLIDQEKKLIRRYYPSTGALYPLEVYIALLNNIRSLKKGLYHYQVKEHALERISNTISTNIAKTWFLPDNAKILTQNTVIIVITGVFSRLESKYGLRSYRYLLLEAGSIVTNFYLLSGALKIGCCEIGGFYDDKLNKAYDLETEKEQVLTTIFAGRVS